MNQDMAMTHLMTSLIIMHLRNSDQLCMFLPAASLPLFQTNGSTILQTEGAKVVVLIALSVAMTLLAPQPLSHSSASLFNTRVLITKLYLLLPLSLFSLKLIIK